MTCFSASVNYCNRDRSMPLQLALRLRVEGKPEARSLIRSVLEEFGAKKSVKEYVKEGWTENIVGS